MPAPNRNLSYRERLNISRLAIRYPWLTIGFWIAVLVAGALCLSSLKYALFPDITFPVVVVNASAPIETAVETEQQLTEPIEQALEQLAGVTDVESTTYPGQAVVSLHFEVGSDLEKSSQTVETALQDVDLPQRATSKVLPINLNEATVASYAIESESQTLEELAQTTRDRIVPALSELAGVLKVNLLGEPVEIDLSQPANLEAALTQAGTLVRFNGQEALAVQIVKQAQANTLEVAKAVENTVTQLQTQLPEVTMTLAVTQADYIRAATQETIHALIEAIVISALVIFPFLWNWRATAISALAIPTSLLGTCIVMAIYGFNLETITLLALAMIVGNVVDDAIVDVENISRHLEQGESPKQAAIAATDEIGLTVTAATLTVVAVFLPVGLMGGVLGQFFKPFGITIAAAMLISLLVARTLSPLLAAYWLKPKPVRQRQNPDRSTGPRLNWLAGMTQSYGNLLRWSLAHRWIVVALSLFSFVAGLALIPLIPKGFIPKLDRGEFNITYTAPPPKIPQELLAAQAASRSGQVSAQVPPQIPSPARSSAARSRETARLSFNPLADSLKVAERLEDSVRQSPQVETVFTVVGSRQGQPNQGSLYVKLKPEHSVSTAAMQDQFRQELPQIAGVTTSVEDIQFVDTGGEKPFQLRLVGQDLTPLNQAARDLKAKLETIPGLEDISTTADASGETIGEIRHHGGKRVAIISANLGPGLTIGEATDRAIAESKTILPAGIALDLGGDSAQAQEILGSFGKTLALSVLCVVLVLLLLFRSWVDTLVVFVSLPLSIVGAMLGLLVAQSDFGMISLLGIIFLLGLTNKNAILIVDYIKQLRRSGRSRSAAILEAAPTRLRPILMTTAATILGMAPLALGLGAGAELRTPMAIAIIGGLITSTLLSLLVVPVIYDLLDDGRQCLSKAFRRLR